MMKIAIIVVVGAQLLLRASWVLAEANILVSITNNPQETSIAINPTNPNNILASSQPNLKYHVSFDGGQTWSEGPLPDLLARSDPVVAFGPNGVAYYSFIGPGSHSGVFVNRSVDGGLSWQPSGTAVIEHSGGLLFEDKPYITTDITGSEYRSNVYIAWTQFDAFGSFGPQDSTRILFSRSTDQGVSFCAPIRVSDFGGDAQDSSGSVMGAIPAVGHDGTVYVAWTGPRGIEFDKSEDGGCNFGQDTVVSDQPGGFIVDIPGIFRHFAFPVVACDISTGRYQGRVYVCWADPRNGDVDILISCSDDKGQNWSPPKRVNDDTPGNGRDQFFPWMTVDPVTGVVTVIFYDRRNHVDLTTDVFLASSVDGGDSFANQELSEASFTPNDSIFFGDYIGVSSWGGRIRPLWVRMDGDSLSIWTALIDPVLDVPTQPEKPKMIVSPNPVRSQATIALSGVSGEWSLKIFNVRGALIRSFAGVASGHGPVEWTWDLRDRNGAQIAGGVYYLSILPHGTSGKVVLIN